MQCGCVTSKVEAKVTLHFELNPAYKERRHSRLVQIYASSYITSATVPRWVHDVGSNFLMCQGREPLKISEGLM
jgi:hypothetical protein